MTTDCVDTARQYPREPAGNFRFVVNHSVTGEAPIVSAQQSCIAAGATAFANAPMIELISYFERRRID
jgi:hypothetical protein